MLNGIFASFREGKLALVATDGRRLAMADMDLEFPASHETDVIYPFQGGQRDTASSRRFRRGRGEKLSDSQISFTVGDTFLASKLIEETTRTTAR